MKIQSKKFTLITGAGFTKNFGGFLASEMWATIFNNPLVQSNEFLRYALLNDPDYESLYEKIWHQKVLIGEEEQKIAQKILTEALSAAYEKLDQIIRRWKYTKDAPYPVNHYGLDEFINRFFTNPKSGDGYIFTLNQDLFLERHFINGSHFVTPGIKYPYQLNLPIKREHPLAKEMYITVPSKIKRELVGSSFYIKLHGSFNWRNEDNTQLVITGQRKLEKILSVDILDWYWDMLRHVLQQGNVKVLLIGYGFRDEHLNRALADAVYETNLKIYIISPNDFTISQDLMSKNGYDMKAFKKGLAGYFQTDLLNLFPSDQSKTQMLIDIEKYFFE